MTNVNDAYLTNMPQEVFVKHGICKTVLVRKEVIHIKHIMTEIFVRKSIDISVLLDYIGYDLFTYMEYLTNRLRTIHHVSRLFNHDVNNIVKDSHRKRFLDTVRLYDQTCIKSAIVIDFDGVFTKNTFREIYDHVISQANNFDIIVCSANPNITEKWFIDHKYPVPKYIYSMKGGIKKIKQLIEIAKRYDVTLQIDDEPKYLDYGWIFGLYTYQYKNNKLVSYSLNTK